MALREIWLGDCVINGVLIARGNQSTYIIRNTQKVLIH